MILNKGRLGENYNIGGHNEWANIDIVKLVCKLMNEYFNGVGLDSFPLLPCALNLSSEALQAKYPLAKSVIEGTAETLITFVEDRAGHDWRYAIDATKTNNELGYKPKESFETGIKKTVEWYLQNESWWKPLIN